MQAGCEFYDELRNFAGEFEVVYGDPGAVNYSEFGINSVHEGEPGTEQRCSGTGSSLYVERPEVGLANDRLTDGIGPTSPRCSRLREGACAPWFVEKRTGAERMIFRVGDRHADGTYYIVMLFAAAQDAHAHHGG